MREMQRLQCYIMNILPSMNQEAEFNELLTSVFNVASFSVSRFFETFIEINGIATIFRMNSDNTPGLCHM